MPKQIIRRQLLKLFIADVHLPKSSSLAPANIGPQSCCMC